MAQTYTKFDAVVQKDEYIAQDGTKKHRYFNVGTAFMYSKTDANGNPVFDGMKLILDCIPFEREIKFFISTRAAEPTAAQTA